MDANRERYKKAVVLPFRAFLDAMAPLVLRLDSRFDTTGRSGANFSRINRDTRFAKDKTPYRAQMYLKFSAPFAGEGETGQLYVALFANTVTVGFRSYGGSKRKESALAQIADPRVEADPAWLTRQKRRLARRYESYWYTTEKGEWTKHESWPTSEEWKKLRGWVVRRKLTPAMATRGSFPREIEAIFRELFPLFRFTSLRD
jgi:uncharacterized protein (DUF2461 family)